jgi:hypothetical protein
MYPDTCLIEDSSKCIDLRKKQKFSNFADIFYEYQTVLHKRWYEDTWYHRIFVGILAETKINFRFF